VITWPAAVTGSGAADFGSTDFTIDKPATGTVTVEGGGVTAGGVGGFGLLGVGVGVGGCPETAAVSFTEPAAMSAAVTV
jgi:hypothetical protein